MYHYLFFHHPVKDEKISEISGSDPDKAFGQIMICDKKALGTGLGAIFGPLF